MIGSCLANTAVRMFLPSRIQELAQQSAFYRPHYRHCDSLGPNLRGAIFILREKSPQLISSSTTLPSSEVTAGSASRAPFVTNNLPRDILFRALKMRSRKRQRESGGIGRRARLRIWYRKVWGFESPLSHQVTVSSRQTAVGRKNKYLERRKDARWMLKRRNGLNV